MAIMKQLPTGTRALMLVALILPALSSPLWAATQTYLNDTWHFVADSDTSNSLSIGDTVNGTNDGRGVTAAYGVTAFGTVSSGARPGTLAPADQLIDAVNATDANGTLTVLPGSYNESSVRIAKALKLNGANAGIAAGADPLTRGAESTITGGFTLAASNIVIDGFTIIGGADPALSGDQGDNEPVGVFIIAGASNHFLRNNIITGNAAGRAILPRYGAGINYVTVSNNRIGGWLTGIYNQGTAGWKITGNRFNNNVSGVSNDESTGVEIRNNDFEGNEGAMGVYNSQTIIENNDFSNNTRFLNHYGGPTVIGPRNWYGTTDAAAIAAKMRSNGTVGDASAVKFTPYLHSGTQVSATPGFQGDYSYLHVTTLGAHAGAVGRVQEGVNSVSAGGIVAAGGGTYSESVNINRTAALAGSPTLTGSLTASATGSVVMPGTSSGVGVISSANVVFGSSSYYRVDLNGAAAHQYDRLVATGTVSLNNATLIVALGYQPANGHSHVIVNNDGNDAVNGTFKNLPQGATTTVNGVALRVNYQGGDGNDVTLTAGPAYTVSGRIANSQGVAIAGATVTLSGMPPVTTSSAGYYNFNYVPAGNYTITPSKANYIFTPATRSVSVTGNLSGQNFIGRTGVTVSGRIATSRGIGIAGVSVTRSAAGGQSEAAPVLTNSAGYFTFYEVPAGTITFTPTRDGYRFTPESRTLVVGNSNLGNVNFIGASGYDITGRITNSSGVGLANVVVRRSGLNTAVTTNSAGYYTFSDVPNGTYSVVPEGTNLSFSPESRAVVVQSANVAGQNFVAAPGYTVSGRIATSAGVGIAGVTVTSSSSATPQLTNSAGYFVFNGVPGGTHVLTPSRSGYSFTPATRSVAVSNANVSGQNFIGITE